LSLLGSKIPDIKAEILSVEAHLPMDGGLALHKWGKAVVRVKE